jgi:hypothetical protein
VDAHLLQAVEIAQELLPFRREGGLTSTPYSGRAIDREQGIEKAGNHRLRTVMVELAWLWQRYQPGAAQVAWFRDRVGSTGRRIREVMVVALARKRLIALWRFVIDDVMPDGRDRNPAGCELAGEALRERELTSDRHRQKNYWRRSPHVRPKT